MSTIQNLKNFIRHGKQARDPRSPPDQATTHVSNVHAQQQRYNQNYGGAAAAHAGQHVGMSVPNMDEVKHAPPLPQDGYSAAAIDNRNVAAKAGHAAAGAVDAQQKRDAKQKDYDSSVLERIVAEERESKGKLPRYPGLERWQLVEKMGDGAFSNVYRAKDNNHVYDQVAIKVVRKFEMNSTQVSMSSFLHFFCLRNSLCGHTASFLMNHCQPISLSGQRPPSRLREESAQGRGGAQPFSYICQPISAKRMFTDVICLRGRTFSRRFRLCDNSIIQIS